MKTKLVLLRGALVCLGLVGLLSSAAPLAAGDKAGKNPDAAKTGKPDATKGDPAKPDAPPPEEKKKIGYSKPGSRKTLYSLKRGQPTKASFAELCAAVAAKEFDLHINLNLGRANALMYASDLTEEYVEFNKGDVTDPSSLGG